MCNACNMSACRSPAEEQIQSNHDLDIKIKAKHRAEHSGWIRENRQKKDRVRPLHWSICPCCLILTQGPLTHSWRIMHEAAWDQRNTGRLLTQETLTHGHSLPALQHTSSLHCIIPLRLSQGLFFVVVINATSMEFERLCSRKEGRGRPQTSLPFALLYWSCHHPDADLYKWPPSGLQMRPL